MEKFHSNGAEQKSYSTDPSAKKNPWSFTRLVTLGIIFVLVYLTTALVSKYFTIQRYEEEKQSRMLELAKLEEDINKLNEEIEHAQDPEFIEKMAREKLKMVKPNETVYIVVK